MPLGYRGYEVKLRRKRTTEAEVFKPLSCNERENLCVHTIGPR
jgi:hypothetical protein